jgi:hypothetical protein
MRQTRRLRWRQCYCTEVFVERLALGMWNDALAQRCVILLVAGVSCALSCGDESTAGLGAGTGLNSSAADSGGSGTRASAGSSGSGDQSAFSISLSTSACLDGCPEYDVKVDQSGNIDFNGRGRTRQQGWAGKTTSAQTAMELLSTIRAAGYWQMSDVYRSRSDGCQDVVTDRATYIWNVMADGAAKVVVDYQGCTGLPVLDALRRVPAMLTAGLELEAWIGT